MKSAHTFKEIEAEARVFCSLRRKASQMRGTMDELKADIEGFIEANDEELNGGFELDDGLAARIVFRAGTRYVEMTQLSTEEVVWAHEHGLLSVTIASLGNAPTGDELDAINKAIGTGAGSSYVDITPPSWQAQRSLLSQEKKKTAAASGQAEEEEQPSPTPLHRSTNPPKPTPQAGNAQSCPNHGKARYSERSSTFYCPGKLNDGSWCKWTSEIAS